MKIYALSLIMQKILEFLDIEWSEDVLHHEKKIGQQHGISLSKVERSSDQVSQWYAGWARLTG